MRLFEIPELWRNVLAEATDEETGEMDLQRLREFDLDVNQKITGTAMYIKEIDADIKILAEQIQKLQARKQSLEKRKDYLKELMAFAMSSTGLRSSRNAFVTVSLSRRKTLEYKEASTEAMAMLAFEHPDLVKTSHSLVRSSISKKIKDDGWEIPKDLIPFVSVKEAETITIR